MDLVLANGDGVALPSIYAQVLEDRFQKDVQPSPSPSVPELQQEQPLFPQVGVGARVQIHGLKSQAVLLLNGRSGTVVRQLASERFAIDIDGGMGVKSIKEINLKLLPASQEEGYSPVAPSENAQVSDAILRSRMHATAPSIGILKFSRTPKAFCTVLAQSPILAARQHALDSCGFKVVLDKGARVLVKPEL